MACFKSIVPVALCFLAACPLSGNRLCELSLIGIDGRRCALKVEIADTAPLRERGLMHRKSMERDRGMLFVFEREGILNFWMKDTHIPLSIAFIGSDGILLEIHDMRPLDTSRTYPSSRPARFALEVNRGWFEAHGIERGSRIILNGCIGK